MEFASLGGRGKSCSERKLGGGIAVMAEHPMTLRHRTLGSGLRECPGHW